MIASDFIDRRLRLFNLLKNKQASVIIYGRNVLKRSPSVRYQFNQFSDLVYLTGYTRPGGILTIHEQDGKPFSTLYLPPRIPYEEMWEGFRTPFEEAQKFSGVDKVLPTSELEYWIARRIQTPSLIFSSAPPHQKRHSPKFQSISQYIDLLRIIKSPKEISLIKKACEISKAAHNISLSIAKPGVSEAQVASRFKLECIERGATGFSYPIVCASGKNATSLHYIENNKIMKEGECLMMDAGCEYMNYASDFTRTVPIGKISEAHSDLLEMVDEIKNFLVRKAQKGQIYSLGLLHHLSEDMLMRGLTQFGLKLNINQLREYYPHYVSHWIGLDVHDCDSIGYDFKLKKGCVFSVEPGIYFPEDSLDIPKELRGIGCRFEDTVIIE
ncbi:Xaa-Pro aminopeptidase 3 [Tritrichomonas musculus]|uniref:Xaa-Pro aminopeptidase 3 n=1 Tax=Tritrichomonas musculus TaxID=1915356 RepID=A0ABR2JMH5_9EUKA